MISKVLCLSIVLAAVVAQHHEHSHGYSSQHISRHDGHAEPVIVKLKEHKGHKELHYDYYAHPKYEFEYKVEDKHTGDSKSQQEHRDGHEVKSTYSLHVPHVHHESKH